MCPDSAREITGYKRQSHYMLKRKREMLLNCVQIAELFIYLFFMRDIFRISTVIPRRDFRHNWEMLLKYNVAVRAKVVFNRPFARSGHMAQNHTCW